MLQIRRGGGFTKWGFTAPTGGCDAIRGSNVPTSYLPVLSGAKRGGKPYADRAEMSHRMIAAAEEAGIDCGAKRMLKDGLFERFPCDAVFALHNHPDRVAPHLRQHALARMQIANRLIDEARRDAMEAHKR